MTVPTIPVSVSQRLRKGFLRHRATFYGVICAVWIGSALWGWSALLEHTYRPAETADAVTDWPDAAWPTAPSASFQIVVFAHPFCPCTRATLQKLDESLTRLPDETRISVIFVTAGLKPAEVAGSSTVEFARRLPGVEVRFDETGDWAERFHARVSGEVFAFDRQGRRRFHGGVTTGRGHLGDAAGQELLERLALGVTEESSTAPVFGCALPRAVSAGNPRRESGANFYVSSEPKQCDSETHREIMP